MRQIVINILRESLRATTNGFQNDALTLGVEIESVADIVCDRLPTDPTVKELYDTIIQTLFDDVIMYPDREQLAGMVMLFQIYTEFFQSYPELWRKVNQYKQSVATKEGEFDWYVTPSFLQEHRVDYAKAYMKRFINMPVSSQALGKLWFNDSGFTDTIIKLATEINIGADRILTYQGVIQWYSRYAYRDTESGSIIDLPQLSCFREACGLNLNDLDADDLTEHLIESYRCFANNLYLHSTTTRHNAGARIPQLSSCFLLHIPDSTPGIMDSGMSEEAKISRDGGGLAINWSSVRGEGSLIQTTGGTSAGVIPFAKIAETVAVAFNQSGRRAGSVCNSLAGWHIDFMDFLDLRDEIGDPRRRTPDANTSCWMPDLFFDYVKADKMWYFFSPDEVPEVANATGAKWVRAYERAIENADKFRCVEKMPAIDLFKKILGKLFETSHPWMIFADAHNARYANSHVGIVRSSNLCTEISLHTSDTETAVCNLASINLARMVTDNQINFSLLRTVTKIATRNLDNVISLNHHPTERTREANTRNRPVGLGIMGFQDLLAQLRVPMSSPEAADIAEKVQREIALSATEASVMLAKKRDTYPNYEGSLWDQGYLIHDTVDRLKILRGESGAGIPTPNIEGEEARIEKLRVDLRRYGIRNGQLLAIAPTASISNFSGAQQSIEPFYGTIYTADSGIKSAYRFNRYLIDDLQDRGLWTRELANELANNLCLQDTSIPDDLKVLYATAFEIDPLALIEINARRQLWVDQAISMNIYVDRPDGRLLMQIYQTAWERGLKSTYYVRSLSASSRERNKGMMSDAMDVGQMLQQDTGVACMLDDPSCESCQ